MGESASFGGGGSQRGIDSEIGKAFRRQRKTREGYTEDEINRAIGSGQEESQVRELDVIAKDKSNLSAEDEERKKRLKASSTLSGVSTSMGARAALVGA